MIWNIVQLTWNPGIVQYNQTHVSLKRFKVTSKTSTTVDYCFNVVFLFQIYYGSHCTQPLFLFIFKHSRCLIFLNFINFFLLFKVVIIAKFLIYKLNKAKTNKRTRQFCGYTSLVKPIEILLNILKMWIQWLWSKLNVSKARRKGGWGYWEYQPLTGWGRSVLCP